jgi:hypothetical protein
MRAAEFFAALAALGGVSIAAVFIGTTVSERKRAATFIATSLIVAIGLMVVELQMSTGWIAAALALAGALTLSWGWLERLLAWVVGPISVLAAHSAWSLLSPLLEPMTATSLLVLSIVGGAMTGLALRRLRLRAWFADLSALSLLLGLALMTGPVLSMGWRRAAIAAEGQDPVPTAEPILLWPLVLATAAFVVGFGWKFIVRNRRTEIPVDGCQLTVGGQRKGLPSDCQQSTVNRQPATARGLK